jgi:type IV secretory pathway VirB4 component
MPVIIDRVGKGDNPGSSDIKIGEQGAGKSVAQKTEIASWLALEDLVIVIDAKNEYGALAEAFGGEIATMGGQGEEGMNILHFSRPATQQLAEVMFDDNVTTIASRYASLKDSLNPSLTGPEVAMITRGLRRAMELKGLDSKDPSTWEPNKVFLEDVYEAIGELKESDHVSASLIMSTLYEYADPEGQYYRKYNTASSTQFTNDFVVIQFGRPGITANEYDRAADYHFAFRQAMNYAIERFIQDERSRPIRIVVDEASQFLVDKYLVGSVIRAVSIGRAFSITVHLAFQSAAALRAADSLSGASGGTAQSINSLTGIGFTYQLFKSSPESALLIGQMLGLTQEETMSISKQGVGEMLLVLPDQHRIPIRWAVPDNWLSLFRTDTATMKQYYRQAFADASEPVGQGVG